ncbi:SMI1/KNR4 family protein [Salmonella enterica]|nr:SMI1/KNR4 family protein [Salmonella enterica]EJH7438666.1 SMI1/KNR4 family protein [Salmonella enterica]EJH7879631.1 SMI1/KNR4 family protein [Salmonella enterica]EJI6710675.1 SMI1/KNR4 family protein [Salmonella enterica]EKS4618716.1 SMI1/KNR4 family protein [Salmonella enterica]
MTIEVSHGVSRLEIEKISSQYGIFFSDDYQDFLFNYNGLFVGNNSYCTIPFSKVDDGNIDFQELYGINSSNPLFDLANVNDIRDEINVFKNPFIIGADPGGNLFLFSGNDNDDAIYYWDRAHIHFDDNFDYHEVNEEGNVYRISDNFTTFYNEIMLNINGDKSITKVVL